MWCLDAGCALPAPAMKLWPTFCECIRLSTSYLISHTAKLAYVLKLVWRLVDTKTHIPAKQVPYCHIESADPAEATLYRSRLRISLSARSSWFISAKLALLSRKREFRDRSWILIGERRSGSGPAAMQSLGPWPDPWAHLVSQHVGLHLCCTLSVLKVPFPAFVFHLSATP